MYDFTDFDMCARLEIENLSTLNKIVLHMMSDRLVDVLSSSP